MDRDWESAVARGRFHYDRCRWADAFNAFRDAQRQQSLERRDMERLAWSAALIGNDEQFLGALECLHRACVEADDPRSAARAAFWLGFRLFALGNPGRASGWLARAERHLDSQPEECAERGYLLVPKIFRHLAYDQNGEAESLADRTAALGERTKDIDLWTIARNLQGRALLRQGDMDRGLSLLDEVMITVTSGELSPAVKGLVYCNVIATCQQFYALDRSREWTAALTDWCEQQPQLVTFTANCHVHRSQIMQLGGNWSAALEEVKWISDNQSRKPDPEVFADACYQEAEIHRLRGEFDQAETAYRRASRSGRDPQPGLALLRLTQVRSNDAVKAIERALATTTPPWRRAQLLPAYVDIMVAAGKLEEGHAAATELEGLAGKFDTAILDALASQAHGTLGLAESAPKDAMPSLRRALGTWQRVGAPYLAARLRVLLARACRALGDEEGAGLEEDAARSVFQELGAVPDLEALTHPPTPNTANRHGLSCRELQVLRLVATGKTNKTIAAELFLSERTVDRHVSHILSKLGVATRSAATAFAYENGLI